MKFVKFKKKITLDLCIVSIVIVMICTACSSGGKSVQPSTSSSSTSQKPTTSSGSGQNQESSSTASSSTSASSISSSQESSSSIESSSSSGASSETEESHYVTKQGWVFACYVANDGALYAGSMQKVDAINRKYDLYLESFPKDIEENGGADYIWTGKNLKYMPVRVCKQETFQAIDGVIAIYKTDENGRIKKLTMSRVGEQKPEDYVNEFYPGYSWFERYPVYLQNVPDNFIWDGKTLTYDSVHK